MWNLIFLILALLLIAGVVYLLCRVRRFSFVKALAEKSRAASWLLAAALTCLPLLFLFVNIFAAVIVYLHLFLFFALCDLVSFVYHKSRHSERKRYVAGAAAVLLTAIYLSAGWFFAHHVFETDYRFETSKELPDGNLRVIVIADLHLGITLDGDEFREELRKVNETRPDAVFLCGDYVDDDSPKEEMVKACSALGELETTYGVYFVFGNHDQGYFSYRDFSSDELRDELEKNGVTILRDESVLVGDSFYVVGRRDRSMAGRKSAEELTKDLDREKYIILLDHQPNDYDAEASSGADLVLSGHTHGGHIVPAGQIGLLLGMNDRIYGSERRGDTTFVVTSGISGWGIPFKTGAISEYAVIDIETGKEDAKEK